MSFKYILTGMMGVGKTYLLDQLPKDLVGDYIVNEPVARIIRRAKVTNNQGKIQLANAYDKKEFIASTDFFFRPITNYTGPDGCMYIVDMARGLIQESNWTKKGPFRHFDKWA